MWRLTAGRRLVTSNIWANQYMPMIGNGRMSDRVAPMGDREEKGGGGGIREGERARWRQTCKERSMQKKLRKTLARLHGTFWRCKSTEARVLKWSPQLSKTWPRTWYVWMIYIILPPLFHALNISGVRMCIFFVLFLFFAKTFIARM